MKILNILKSFYWFLSDRCEYCGGDLNIWDYKRAYCKECGRKN